MSDNIGPSKGVLIHCHSQLIQRLIKEADAAVNVAIKKIEIAQSSTDPRANGAKISVAKYK